MKQRNGRICTHFLMSTHILLLIVASSYITLGIADTHVASTLWAPYAVTTFILAVANLLGYQRILKRS